MEQNISTAQREYFKRPKDERFQSLEALVETAQEDKDNSAERCYNIRDLKAIITESPDGGENLRVSSPTGVARFTHYSFGQTCRALKMPANYLELGLISLLFPKSKVIHCVRDPRATCTSIYFQNFVRRRIRTWACDLNRIGLRYHHYMRIMRYWRDALPIPILEVVYESLVDDTDVESRRLLEFCGLRWDNRVLNFHQTERVVQTASMWQVRKPIYRDSLALWENYERHLEPLEQGLAGKEI